MSIKLNDRYKEHLMEIGSDIIEIDRIKQAQEKQAKFVDRVLTPAELDLYKELKGHRKYEFLAGRFAAKEAFAKAYGTGISGKLSMLDIEILPGEYGKPVVSSPYTGEQKVTISHSNDLAIAVVILN
ncbi:MAG TPA: holo-[acyl-carrier-protein] synthase [Bavariicoccus seileri]|uniref:Holo-[acyl-carrier-protein] synthase n=2 Tax=Bavariicoccus seileri TaxID=549685 RepID=A0A3D4S463_9ENTE|nr:holo-[acyl-carrier-protein] synthase [Bavariicoccus seileri]